MERWPSTNRICCPRLSAPCCSPQLTASFLSASFTDVAESIGRELLVYGRRIPKAEMFARIDAVDADTVRAVADRFIYDQDVAIAAVGDTQFLPDYNW